MGDSVTDPLTFARLSEQLDTLETNEVAPAFERLSRQHTLLDEDERVDNLVLNEAEAALENLADDANKLVAVQAGRLHETESKIQMRETALEIEETLNSFYALQSSLEEECLKLENPAVYDDAVEEVQTALDEQIDYLQTMVADIRDQT